MHLAKTRLRPQRKEYPAKPTDAWIERTRQAPRGVREIFEEGRQRLLARRSASRRELDT